MLKTLFTAGALAIAAPAFAVAQVSSPATFTAGSIGTSVTRSYNGFVEEELVAGLLATTIFTLRSVSADRRSWTFDAGVSNTSSGAITASRVSIFGFDVSQAIDRASAAGVFATVGTDGNVPQIGPTLDVCFRAGGGGSGCANGGGGGVMLGESYSEGRFVLRFSEATEAVTLNNFFVRYQSIEGTARGDSGVGVDDLQPVGGVAGVVPETATWAMLIIGLGIVGAARRRRQQVSA